MIGLIKVWLYYLLELKWCNFPFVWLIVLLQSVLISVLDVSYIWTDWADKLVKFRDRHIYHQFCRSIALPTKIGSEANIVPGLSVSYPLLLSFLPLYVPFPDLACHLIISVAQRSSSPLIRDSPPNLIFPSPRRFNMPPPFLSSGTLSLVHHSLLFSIRAS